jgi:Tol biopolymer transport system component
MAIYTRAALGAPLLALASTACFNINQGPVDVPDLRNDPDVNPPPLVLSRPDTDGNWDIYSDDLTSFGIPNQTSSDSAIGSKKLTDHPARDEYPSLSPDGLRVVFQSERAGNWELYVTDTGGALRPTRLTDHPTRDVRPAWSPDGSKIAFASDRSGSGTEIYRISPDGAGVAIMLTHRGSVSTDPDWSPDGSKLVFSSVDESGFSQVYLMNADGTEQTRLTSAGVASESPVWSRDGSEIAFVRDSEIWVMNVDGSDARVLAGEEREFLSAPDWNDSSGDTIGFQLTCCVRPQGVYLYNRVNGNLVFVTAGGQPDWY